MAPHSVDLPHCAQPHADEIHAIESELDVLWPGYERVRNIQPDHNGNRVQYPGYKLRGRPFGQGGKPMPPYDVQHLRRLKWLLKRHSLLMRGLDYGVVVADGHGRQAGALFAHPTSEQRPHPEPPPRVSPPAFGVVLPPEAKEQKLTAAQEAVAAVARPNWRP